MGVHLIMLSFGTAFSPLLAFFGWQKVVLLGVADVHLGTAV